MKAQTVEPNTATDLLLNGDSKPNRFSRQCAENEEPDANLTENLLHDEKSNKNTITGTNTPRSSRASAYYDLLRSQHKNGHYKAHAYRVVDAIESPMQAGASALNYHDDFDTDAVQNAGLHMAVAQTVVEGNIMAAAADSAFVIGKQTGNILKDLKDETINAKDALKAGGQVLRLQGGKSVVKIGGATLRSTEQYHFVFSHGKSPFLRLWERAAALFCCRPLITHQQGQTGLSTVGVAHSLAVDWLGWICYFSSNCSSKKNSSSNFLSSAIHKIRANLAVGLNCPVSIELTVFLDTPIISARSLCESPFSARAIFRRFFNTKSFFISLPYHFH